MYVNRVKHEHDQRMTQAWTIAALQRTKKLPALDKLLTPKHKHHSPDEMRAALFQIFKSHGKPGVKH